MPIVDHVNLEEFIRGVRKRNPGQEEFIQAVQEIANDVFEYIETLGQRTKQR